MADTVNVLFSAAKWSLLFLASHVLVSSAEAQSEAFDREFVGSWVVECLPGQSGPGECQLYQRITTNDANVVAMVVTFAWSVEEENLQTQIALPLGVLLSFQPQLAIDNSYVQELRWSRCTMDGCMIEGAISQEMVDRLTSASAATIAVVHPTEGTIQLPVALDGFTSALSAVLPQ